MLKMSVNDDDDDTVNCSEWVFYNKSLPYNIQCYCRQCTSCRYNSKTL